MQPLVRMRERWTVADLHALDVEDWRRYEIVDGALVVSPSAGREHELASAELRSAVSNELPDGLIVIGPMGVEVGRSYRIPDLLVVERAGLRGSELLQPAEVFLVVEVVSPGSVTTDRITKPAQYAAAGIPAYWRVETEPVSLTAYSLPPGADVYVEVGSWGSSEVARLVDPFPVEIDIDRLGVG